MPTIPALTTIGPGTITAAPHNNNYATIRTYINTYGLFLDVAAQTVSVAVTFSASQTFSAGIALTGALTMATAVSKIVPGATSFSIRNNADAADNLILLDSGAATFRSTVGGITTLTATTLAGTLSTAAQPNITSLGTLTAATITTLTTQVVVPNGVFALKNVGNTVAALEVTATYIAMGTAAGVGISVLLGQSIATNATAGHVELPFCGGIATGVPANGIGKAMVYDATNKKIGIYDGAWIWTAALT